MSQTGGLEVLLFGPGYGECVLVHLGAGQWMIVDSCLGQRGQQPALDYLSSIGATPDTDVRLVVATHWHDDHVAGLGRVVETCANADFVCSAAMQTEEFLSLVFAGTRAPERRSGVEEFARVIDLLGARGFESPRWAMGDRRLLSRREGPPCEVWALSPSDEAFNRSLAEFGGLLEEQRGPVRRRVRAPSPNHAAVVLWVRVGAHIALLAADLETHGHEGLGWTAVLDSTERPREPASLYKVAHHGSPTGDHPGIWTELLTSPVDACLAPFTRGRVPRPQPSDVERICSRAESLYQTAPAAGPAARQRAAPVDQTIAEVSREFRGLEPATGCVHLRPRSHRQEDGWEATLSDRAFEACGSSVPSEPGR